MQNTTSRPDTIVTARLFTETQKVITHVRSNDQWGYLLDAKLGDQDNKPMSDNSIAAVHGTPLNAVRTGVARIIDVLSQTDQQYGNPLAETAQWANSIMERAAIVNLHRRRPALYSEATLAAFIKLGAATPQSLPVIRAAGYVSSPPVVPRSHGIDSIIADVAAHMARSHEPQSPARILQSIGHRRDLLNNWPQLDLALFIYRVADILPGKCGFYRPDQSWGKHISARKLVASTTLRILTRDHRPHTTAHLAEEIRRLVGRFLPPQYNISEAVRAAAYESDEFSWQGLSTFGLKIWDTSLEPHDMLGRRGRTGDLIYAYLMQHGPADMQDIIAQVQRTTNIKRRTIQDAVNHDPANRFLKLDERRVAANPVPQDHNPTAGRLVVIPDDAVRRPAPVLRESELVWLTHYLRALNALEPPLPLRIAMSGARADGLALGDPIAIMVVIDSHDRTSLEPRLVGIATAASETVPSVRPRIIILSPERWNRQQSGETAPAHYNVWLAPRTSP